MNPATADRYAAIERMYSLGQWQQVLDASDALLAALPGDDDPSLRQRLLLLQGHTRLHGLGQIDAATALYQQVLDSQPEPVLLAVAQHELARAQAMTVTTGPALEPAIETTVEPAPSEPTLLSHAFPFTAEAVGMPPPGQPAAAAPWLETVSQPQRPAQAEPAPQPNAAAPEPAPPWLSEPAAVAPTPTPVETLEIIEVIEEPEQIAFHQTDPDHAQIVDLAPWSPAEEAELARGLLEVVLR
jgi:hypothetical protein